MQDQPEVPAGEPGPQTQTAELVERESARAQIIKPSEPRREPDLVWFGHSETIGKIVGALSKAQGTFKAIKRTQHADIESRRTGAKYGYDYAPLAEVLEAVTPALSANGLALAFFPLTRSTSVVVRTLLAHESGEFFHNDLAATSEGTDPRSIGSCVTYLSRYGAQSICGVAPGWDDDGERASTPQGQPSTNGAPLPQPGPRSSQPSAAPSVVKPEPPKPDAVVTLSGTITAVDMINGKARVKLSGGETCGTGSPEIIESVRRLQENGRKVELTVKHAGRPDKYLPTIVEIQILDE